VVACAVGAPMLEGQRSGPVFVRHIAHQEPVEKKTVRKTILMMMRVCTH
jgi:hypothetical protein